MFYYMEGGFVSKNSRYVPLKILYKLLFDSIFNIFRHFFPQGKEKLETDTKQRKLYFNKTPGELSALIST
jgi:hypothetical protein